MRKKVTHRKATQVEIDSAAELTALFKNKLKIERPHIYNSTKPDLICRCKDSFGIDIPDPGIECKAYRPFAAGQINIVSDGSKFVLHPKHNNSEKLQKVVTAFNNLNLYSTCMGMFPSSKRIPASIDNDICIDAIVELCKARGIQIFSIENKNGKLMYFLVDELKNYVEASVQFRWHKSGSDKHFAKNEFVDLGFDNIFSAQGATYRIFRDTYDKKEKKTSNQKYVYLETNAILNDVFEYTTNKIYRFEKVEPGIWQVGIKKPDTKTYSCLELRMKIIGTQISSHLDDVISYLTNGTVPKRKYKIKRILKPKKYRVITATSTVKKHTTESSYVHEN
jgi:hypothetical protein